MMIFLKNYSTWSTEALLMNGYRYRKEEGDWTREESSARGRWHAKVISKKVLDIHYDLFIEWRHVSFDLPETHNQERRRFLGRISRLKKRELGVEEWQALQAKYNQ